MAKISRFKWAKLAKSQRKDQDIHRWKPGRLNFTDHRPDPDLYDQYFGGFAKDKIDGKSGDHHRVTAKPERARFLNLLPVEQRGFARYRQPTPGWAANGPRRLRPFEFQAVAEAVAPQRCTEILSANGKVVSVSAESAEDFPGVFLPSNVPGTLRYFRPFGLYLDAAAFYKPSKEWSRSNRHPTAIREERRFRKGLKGRARISANPLLTEGYLKGTPGLIRELDRGIGEWLMLKFLAQGGVIQVFPAETTAAQLKRKIGRPTINDQPMTAAERKRRSRQKAKTLPPQERNVPGAVVPTPHRPAVPGIPFIEIEHMVTLLERDLANEYHERLGEILDRLAVAPPDYILSQEEFTIVAAAAVLSDRLRKPPALN